MRVGRGQPEYICRFAGAWPGLGRGRPRLEAILGLLWRWRGVLEGGTVRRPWAAALHMKMRLRQSEDAQGRPRRTQHVSEPERRLVARVDVGVQVALAPVDEPTRRLDEEPAHAGRVAAVGGERAAQRWQRRGGPQPASPRVDGHREVGQP
jgi:hypothetical protein